MPKDYAVNVLSVKQTSADQYEVEYGYMPPGTATVQRVLRVVYTRKEVDDLRQTFVAAIRRAPEPLVIRGAGVGWSLPTATVKNMLRQLERGLRVIDSGVKKRGNGHGELF